MPSSDFTTSNHVTFLCHNRSKFLNLSVIPSPTCCWHSNSAQDTLKNRPVREREERERESVIHNAEGFVRDAYVPVQLTNWDSLTLNYTFHNFFTVVILSCVHIQFTADYVRGSEKERENEPKRSRARRAPNVRTLLRSRAWLIMVFSNCHTGTCSTKLLHVLSSKQPYKKTETETKTKHEQRVIRHRRRPSPTAVSLRTDLTARN